MRGRDIAGAGVVDMGECRVRPRREVNELRGAGATEGPRIKADRIIEKAR